MEVFSFFRQMKTEPEIISKNKKKNNRKSIYRTKRVWFFISSFLLVIVSIKNRIERRVECLSILITVIINTRYTPSPGWPLVLFLFGSL